MKSTTVFIHAVGRATLLRRTGQLHRLYRECFGTPPWSEPEERLAAFPAQLRRQLGHGGAGGFLALLGDEVVGAVYGWAAPAELPRDSPFEAAVATAAPAGALARMVAPALVVGELMVAEAYRRRGIAARLLRSYVAAAPAAWLATHRDGGAPTFYRGQGWREEAEFFAGGIPLLLFTWGVVESA